MQENFEYSVLKCAQQNGKRWFYENVTISKSIDSLFKEKLMKNVLTLFIFQKTSKIPNFKWNSLNFEAILKILLQNCP